MTTMTDDIGPRLAAVEAHISNINTQLAEIKADQRQMREEFQAENRAMRAEHQAYVRTLHERIDQTNARIDQTNAKIDRLLYVVLGAFVTLAVGMVLLYLRIGP